jgi:hypothetical protein
MGGSSTGPARMSKGPTNVRSDREEAYVVLVDRAMNARGKWVEMPLSDTTSVSNAHSKAGREVARRFCDIQTSKNLGNPLVYLRIHEDSK